MTLPTHVAVWHNRQPATPRTCPSRARAEFDPLTRSAPRLAYGVPDYYGLSEGILTVVNSYMLQQLDLAATYWHLTALAADLGDEDGRLWDLVNLTCVLLAERAEGWRLFRADCGLDPEGMPSRMPGWDTVQQALAMARLPVVNRAGAVRYLRQRSGDDQAEPFTAEDVRAQYRTAVESQAATWK